MKSWKSIFQVNLKSELKEYFLFTTFFSFASALILIFEPVFFYQQGISLTVISLYYLLHYILYLFLLPLGAKFAYKFGLEKSLSFSMPLFVIYFLMLAALPKVPAMFWLAWMVLAVFKILYWPAANASMVKFGDKLNQGTELSWLFALSYGVGVLGPMIGGVVATYFGFPWLFLVAASLALFAVIPLLKTKESYRPVNFSYTKSWQLLVSRKNWRLGWSMGGWGENLVDMVYWPIFMFIMLGGADTLGYVASLNVLLMAILGFFIGEFSDKLPPRKILRLHLPFLVLSYLLRPLAVIPWGVLMTDALGRASFIGVRLPMWHYLFTRAKKNGPLQYMTMVEMQLSIAKAVTAAVLAVVFMTTSFYTGFVVAFGLAGLLTVLYLLM